MSGAGGNGAGGHRRVLHVAHTTELGLRVVPRLAEDQVRRGWAVAIACREDHAARDWLGTPGIRHEPWEAGRDPTPATPAEVHRLRGVLRRWRPDLVHLHSSKAGFAGRLALRGKVPTVFQPHAWSFEAVTGPVRAAAVAWERWAARWAHAVVCVSEAERAHGVGAGIGARYAVIPNGVDLAAFPEASELDRAQARRRLDLGAGPVVVCVGRLARQKGQELLLRAWPLVRREVPEALLVLVGDGPDRVALEQAAGEGVRFAGYRDDVPDWLAATDVVTLASLWEGMPLTVLEAMARGRPLVATQTAGVAESVAGEAGAVVPLGDVAGLARGIADRLLDPALAREEGRAGRRRAERLYDFAQTGARVEALYERLMRGERPVLTPPLRVRT